MGLRESERVHLHVNGIIFHKPAHRAKKTSTMDGFINVLIIAPTRTQCNLVKDGFLRAHKENSQGVRFALFSSYRELRDVLCCHFDMVFRYNTDEMDADALHCILHNRIIRGFHYYLGADIHECKFPNLHNLYYLIS